MSSAEYESTTKSTKPSSIKRHTPTSCLGSGFGTSGASLSPSSAITNERTISLLPARHHNSSVVGHYAREAEFERMGSQGRRDRLAKAEQLRFSRQPNLGSESAANSMTLTNYNNNTGRMLTNE